MRQIRLLGASWSSHKETHIVILPRGEAYDILVQKNNVIEVFDANGLFHERLTQSRSKKMKSGKCVWVSGGGIFIYDTREATLTQFDVRGRELRVWPQILAIEQLVHVRERLFLSQPSSTTTARFGVFELHST